MPSWPPGRRPTSSTRSRRLSSRPIATPRPRAGRATRKWKDCATPSATKPILPSRRRSPNRCSCAPSRSEPTFGSASITSPWPIVRIRSAGGSHRRHRCSGAWPNIRTPRYREEVRPSVHLHRPSTALRRAGAGDGRGRRVPDAPPHPRRSCRRHRRRYRHRRAGRRDPRQARARQADFPAILHLGRARPEGRFRRELLLQEAGIRAHHPAHRADALACRRHHRARGADRGAARRARRPARRQPARPLPDGFFRARLLGPGVRHRLSADLHFRGQAQLAAGAGLPAHRRKCRRLGRPPRAAEPDARRDLCRADRPHDPRQRHRGAHRGLHPHRARQGIDPARHPDPARAPERRDSHRHGHRARHRAADRRRGGHRERLQYSRSRAAHGRRGAGPRLSGDPGHHPAVLVCLCAGQSLNRSHLQLLRSEDPLLTIEAEDERAVARLAAPQARPTHLGRRLLHHRSVVIGGALVLLMVAIAILAPLLGTVDPKAIDPAYRNRVPGTEHVIARADGAGTTRTFWMGTDSLGRDVYSRVIYGAPVALISGCVGLAIGLIAGYLRWVDVVIMRVMDGLMAIPGILLAIGLVAVWGAGLFTVILAIVVPEIPRVVRLVRSIVLTIREEPYVEAAISVGTPVPLILIRHVMPNTFAPMIVQATFVCASAILIEAILSFLGIGIPTDIPTWGNIMAEGRQLFRVYPHTILFPGVFVAVTVLAVNMLGDGLRDALDPRMAKSI